MTNTKQPQHTQGEWRIVTGLQKAGDLCIHVKGKQICDFPQYNSTLEDNENQRAKLQEAEANACRIVKAVNMHDELVSKLKQIQAVGNCKYHGTDSTIAQIFDTEFKNLDSLLKQAEQK